MTLYTVKEYDATNIKNLVWPKTIAASYVRAYVEPIFEDGINPNIGNVSDKVTRLKLLHIIPEDYFQENDHSEAPDELVLPMTINVTEDYENYNCFTVSPYHHFISYGRDELQHNPIHPIIKLIMRLILAIFSLFFRVTSMEKILIVNNWMLSTNLTTNLNTNQIEAITTFLCGKYPAHAIIFRSINDSITKDLLERFKRVHYLTIASRMVYVIDARDKQAWKARSMRQDLKLLNTMCVRGWDQIKESTKYRLLNAPQIIEFATKNGQAVDERNPYVQHIVKLYNMLYQDKYSKCNVQFTPKFVSNALKHNTLTIKAFLNVETNNLDGVVGYFRRVYCPYDDDAGEWLEEDKRTVQTCPLFGYDTSKSQIEYPLYQLLSGVLAEDGQMDDVYINQSSGAAQFKRFRGCSSSVEYMTVYEDHLSILRRIPWHILNFLLTVTAKPIMQRYQL